MKKKGLQSGCLSPGKWKIIITLFGTGFFLEILENMGILYAFEIGELLVSCCIYYTIIYVRISAGLNLSRKNQKIVSVIFWTVLAVYASGWLPVVRSLPLRSYAGALCKGIFGIAQILFILEIVFSLIFPSHSRRRVIIVLVILAVVSGYSAYNGSAVLVTKELTVPVKTLPKNMSGFTIVHLSDLHIGNRFKEKWLMRTVKETNRLKPDLIVITGDLCDITKLDRETRYIIDHLGKLNAEYGILAVTGNHEYDEGLHTFPEIAREAGLRVLRNESVTVAGVIQVAGINDPWVRESGDRGPDLEAALKNIDPQKPVILLSHRPKYFDEALGYGVDLQLSGHTHGGQPPPWELLVGLAFKYSYGLYNVGDSYLHTSAGTGVYGVPMRLFTHNEITRITLTSAEGLPFPIRKEAAR
jgi:predicted MPP superfamily phosphohydrolase